MALFESIVVSGKPFSGKTTLSKLVAEHFGWKYISIGEMWRTEWKKRYPKGDMSFENYWNETTDDENRAMDKMAGDVVRRGHVVADMRYGFLHRDPQTLIIFIDCDIDERAKRALEGNKYPGRDFAQIKDIIEQRERDEVDRCQALYKSNYQSPENYDMLFDSTNAAPDEALEKILSLK